MRSVLKRFDPFSWPNYVVQTIAVAFFAIMLPVYIFIGLQPAAATDFSHYPRLEIDSINLNTPVEQLTLTSTNELISPAQIAGSFSQAANKTLLIGHSTTIFQNLNKVNYADAITFNDKTYTIEKIEILPKSDIKMAQILKSAERPTIVLMTCTGEHLKGDDFSHRLIITASLKE